MFQGTDLSTHLSLKDDHPWWAWVTLSWMFMPFTIHVAMFCYRLARNKLRGAKASDFCCCKTMSCKPTCRKPGCFKGICVEANFGDVCLHLPFVQTVRNLWNAWKLHKLGFGTEDFDIAHSAEVEAILREVGLAGQYESFFESGPQSVTQCVIFLCTGKISWIQILSVFISIVSLTWGAGRSFFIQREAHMSDPDPPALMVLMRAFFYMLIVVTNNLLLWSFIGGFLGRFTILALLFNFASVYLSLKILGGKNEDDRNIEEEIEINQEIGTHSVEAKVDPKPMAEPEPQYFCLKASICAVWIPSVVGDKDKMYLVSAIVSLISKVLILCLAVGIAFSGNQHLVHKRPFLLWCQRSLSRMSAEESIEICSFRNHSCFEFSSDEDEKTARTTLMTNGSTQNEVRPRVHQKLRQCDPDEEETKFFLLMFCLLFGSTLASLVSSLMLHKIRDYAELYKISKKWLCIKTEPIVHRSLLFSTIERDDSELLSDLLKGDRKKIEEYVNRPNHKGQFALHMSANLGNAKCTLLLMQAGAIWFRRLGKEKLALENLVTNLQSEENIRVINSIARILIKEAQTAYNQTYTLEQLTARNSDGKAIASVLEKDLFKKLSRWDTTKEGYETIGFKMLVAEFLREEDFPKLGKAIRMEIRMEGVGVKNREFL